MGMGNQRIESLEIAEVGMHRLVIGDVVTAIAQRRITDGRHPHRIHAQPLEVVQPLAETIQIPDPIAIAIGEAARNQFVDHRPLPPGGGALSCGGSGHGTGTLDEGLSLE